VNEDSIKDLYDMFTAIRESTVELDEYTMRRMLNSILRYFTKKYGKNDFRTADVEKRICSRESESFEAIRELLHAELEGCSPDKPHGDSCTHCSYLESLKQGVRLEE